MLVFALAPSADASTPIVTTFTAPCIGHAAQPDTYITGTVTYKDTGLLTTHNAPILELRKIDVSNPCPGLGRLVLKNADNDAEATGDFTFWIQVGTTSAVFGRPPLEKVGVWHYEFEKGYVHAWGFKNRPFPCGGTSDQVPDYRYVYQGHLYQDRPACAPPA